MRTFYELDVALHAARRRARQRGQAPGRGSRFYFAQHAVGNFGELRPGVLVCVVERPEERPIPVAQACRYSTSGSKQPQDGGRVPNVRIDLELCEPDPGDVARYLTQLETGHAREV